ncbi:MAG TPA: hypothetical protein VJB05_03625 [archaeon]|nr:hypothetical protein [archaeon]
MKIVSISMKEDVFAEFEKTRKELGFTGRSDLFRKSVNLLLEERKALNKLKGHLDCVLMILHKKEEARLNLMLHQYQGLVRTHVHSVLCDNKCLDIVVIHGDAGNVRMLYETLRKNKKLECVKLIVP